MPGLEAQSKLYCLHSFLWIADQDEAPMFYPLQSNSGVEVFVLFINIDIYGSKFFHKEDGYSMACLAGDMTEP